VEAAINGATSKTVNPHVPRTVPEIVASARACLDAGAAIIHNHNDEPITEGRHAAEPYREAWTQIYDYCPDAVLYPTMGGGGSHTNIGERYAHIEELADAGVLRVAVIDPGSVNLAPVSPDGLPVAIDFVYQNTFADVRYMVDFCQHRSLAATVSIFEPGFLRLALAYDSAGRLPPAKIQLYFGGPALMFGLPPTAPSLEAYTDMLAASGRPWMVAVIGGNLSDTLAELAIERGGHVRVGLEDYTGPGEPRNEVLVAEIAEMARRIGRPLATPAEAATILGMTSAP